jgi:hypothetical protein
MSVRLPDGSIRITLPVPGVGNWFPTHDGFLVREKDSGIHLVVRRAAIRLHRQCCTSDESAR